MDDKQEACRSCGAPIIWAATAAGKRMPLDAEPIGGGQFLLGRSPGDGTATVIRRAVDDRPGYTSHFATCPQAARWRRP